MIGRKIFSRSDIFVEIEKSHIMCLKNDLIADLKPNFFMGICVLAIARMTVLKER